MKIEVALVFTLLLTLTFTSASLSVPCSENMQCDLSLGGGYSCIQRTCTQEMVVSVPDSPANLLPQSRELSWNLFAVEERQHTDICSGSSCLSFAPVEAKQSWQRLLDFVLYANV